MTIDSVEVNKVYCTKPTQTRLVKFK